MQQIAEWLAKIGLERYAPAFIENDIDVSVLRYLTDADLEKIGVSLGHRRKLLAAIAELESSETAATRPAPAPSEQHDVARTTPAPIPGAVAPPPPAAAGDAAGERRYLTVMFCDLVGSTGIAAKLDAEEWRDLVGSYLDAASAAVAEMGGHVAKKLGDGLLALFGYPLAHENDVERAVRAALSIPRALTELNRKNAGTGKPELTARIGLETGSAVVDATGEIYGDVANIAARGRRWPSRARSWPRRGCRTRLPACSSLKSAAAMRSRASRSRRYFSASCVQAAAAAAPDSASSRRSSAATTKSRC